MQNLADQSVAPTTIRADLCAIFISLELSRSTWLVTSLSPGGGEKMSKHSVSAGDIAALLARFSELRKKACARTGKSFPIVVIQEAGLDGFWIHRVLLSEGIESHVVDAASIATSRRRRRAKTDRIDGETLLRALLAHKRGEPRVCSMVRAPSPEDEDRRRICRERKVLIMERVQHVNRIKGLLFSQGASGYEPLRRDRRAQLDTLQTGDGRRLPQHLKAQICRELDSNCFSSRSRLWRLSETRCSAQNKPKCRPRHRCCWVSMALGLSSLRSSGLRVSPDTSITADRSPLMPALPRRLGKAGRSIASRASRNQATRDYGQR
jgi:transposase